MGDLELTIFFLIAAINGCGVGFLLSAALWRRNARNEISRLIDEEESRRIIKTAKSAAKFMQEINGENKNATQLDSGKYFN